jgi:hypothetical protein
MISTLIASAVLQSGTVPAPKSITAGKPYIWVKHLKAIDNVDAGDALGANRADFFALVKVNGVTYKTEIMSKDDGEPNWMIPIDMNRRYSKIHLSLMDEDGGLEGKDDHIDINPRKNRKDLEFTYDRYSGRIYGAVNGRFNETIESKGGGDDDKGMISFVITKSW